MDEMFIDTCAQALAMCLLVGQGDEVNARANVYIDNFQKSMREEAKSQAGGADTLGVPDPTAYETSDY